MIERFVSICRELPADQIRRVVPKLRDEAWPRLVAQFNLAFAYQHIFSKLRIVGDYASTLILAEAVLAVRPRDETRSGLWFDPFYLKDLEYTNVFESVASIDEAHAETALALVTKTLGRVVGLGKAATYPPFAINEPFSLFNTNFFKIDLAKGEPSSPRDNIEDLAALVVLFLQRTIGHLCGNVTEARRIYEKYVAPLPDSRSMWCIKLVAISLCPQVFLPEIKEATFQIFGYEEPWLLTAGAEYHRLLKAGFSKLSPTERGDYFARVLARFAADGVEPQIKNRGWKLLSGIYADLSEDERRHACGAFGKPLDPALLPRPAVERAKGGWVSPKGLVTLEDFSAIPVIDILEKLRDDWSPARLREQDTTQDFLNPLNAEGMGRLLRADFPRRAQAYLKSRRILI